MTDPTLHLRDDQLLLYASGEMQDCSDSVASHLKSCGQCRVRITELENTFAEFARAQHAAIDTELPSPVGPRALLKAQLSDLSSHVDSVQKQSNGGVWPTRAVFQNWQRIAAVASVVLIVLLATNRARHRMETENLPPVLAEKPDAQLTPGAIVATTQPRLCSASTDAPATIPASMRTRVLQLYGVAAEHSDAYEVDYLITPELGGATDIRNLWPEPYDHTVWNAHVKDRLENRLREMVCRGDLDLATAQHDISADWIAAYRKYFHADTPVLNGSS
jgi:hypothetical protein